MVIDDRVNRVVGYFNGTDLSTDLDDALQKSARRRARVATARDQLATLRRLGPRRIGAHGLAGHVAVLEGRHAHARLQCQNNQKPLALALHNYHAQAGAVPQHADAWRAATGGRPAVRVGAIPERLTRNAAWCFRTERR
ncbi:DUF1559 family PulG-like putative transporter [Gemmata massiliana]|uniref:DUF1559 family PulG-like putative transporter n=1 Tax=Gemmata massiliana TaxID=1210884 RepID=UPI0036F3CA54